MTRDSMRTRRRGSDRGRLVGGALYVAVMTAIAAVAAWPIYRSSSFVILVIVSAIVGGGIAIAARRFSWTGWITAVVTAGALLVLGVPLAVPSRLGSPLQWVNGLLDVVLGAVTAWKDLLTVQLPVGDYRNLLVPALIVFLVGVTAGLGLVWRRGPISALVVVVMLTMVFFGLFFGRPVVSDPIIVGPFTIVAPSETLTGALGLIASLLWLAWKSFDERSRALRRAASTSGVRLSRSRASSETQRMVLGGSMILGAVLVAAIVAPSVAQGLERTVPRSQTTPELALTQSVSPLADYRENFSLDRSTAVLFRVSSDGELPDRVRIATLDHYDGEVYRAYDPDGNVAAARFVRVPSVVRAGEGTAVQVEVSIDALSGVWMPTVGRLESVRFDGPRSTSLADSFYYSRSAWSGIEVADGGWSPDDGYTLNAVVPDARPLEQIQAPGSAGTTVEAPDTLVRWVDEHVEGTGGAALAGLAALLRERGYLSHSLSIDPADPPSWVTELPGYTFQPSVSGHSLARIDAMFRSLLERESQADPTESMVAAVGDDEQFAVAVALIAEQLGFPARVVVGARLVDDGSGLPTCEAGLCRGSDVSVWTEVQSAEGAWNVVDATPQSAEAPVTDTTQQRDPLNDTEVRPESAQEVVPPDPVQQDAARPDDAPDGEEPDLSALWATLRIGSIALLVLALVLGPFLVVVLAKRLRRRARRTHGSPAQSIVGGWDEYVDAAVDHGFPAPRAQTRSELAALYTSPGVHALAERADRAVFSVAEASESESDDFWRIVDAERRALSEHESVWKKAVAAVSLRSFTRSLGTRSPSDRDGVSARMTERRARRPGGETHTT